MCDENKNEKKVRIFSCCGRDGITEMMKDCFPDDAGFSACLAEINESWKKFCGQKTENAAPKESQSFCCS